MGCDMCGKENRLFKTDVEGSILNLCKGCSEFGKVMPVVKRARVEEKKETILKPLEEEIVWVVVSDYGQRIKEKREQLKMNQEEFAKKISEKVSLIHKMEITHFEPSIELARKLEKSLHITLIEKQDIESSEVSKTKSEHFTLGDFIKVRKKQK